VLKTVTGELNLDVSIISQRVVQPDLLAKNALVGPQLNMLTDTIIQQEDMRANRPMIGQIYDAYAAALLQERRDGFRRPAVQDV
jgi:DNA helicase-2/ATP-dependent DNA helicase PcrA